MRMISVLLSAAVLAFPLAADAQDADQSTRTTRRSDASRIGVGVFTSLGAPGVPTTTGASLIYDARDWRLATLFGLGIERDDDASLALGARFLYALRRGSRADFSLGPGLTVVHLATGGGAEDLTFVVLEAVAQIRVFLAPEVAFHGALGLGIGVGEGEVSLSLGGQVSGLFGLTYFF